VSVQILERRLPGPALEPAPEPAAAPSRHWALALGALFCVASVYHWLQSRGHVTPAIFTDELMFSELARSVAGGEGLKVRGQDFLFPGVVPVLFQAPAWLAGGATAYGLAKSLNALLMCLAVFPAWTLARLFLRPAHAFAVAVATVAGGAMLYHSYLTSEAVAYPIFLLAVAVCVRAIAEPSHRWDLAAVLVLVLAVLTRAQFVVLPVAFVVAVLVMGRPLRSHVLALASLGALGAAAAVQGVSGLGFYSGAVQLDYAALETLRWAGWTAALLPFAAGMLVVPGAILGLGHAVARPRSRAEGAFGAMALLLLVAFPLQAGLIASGEADRPLERYVFYAVPLLFASFFLYVERGAPRRMLYAGVALAVGGLALAVPLAALAVDPFSFGSPTLSAVADLGRRLALGDAAALFATGGLLAALVAAVVPLRRAAVPVAALSIVLAFAVGASAYSGDRRMTRGALEASAPAQPNWLDRLGLPDADVLVLPGGSLHPGWMLESWNRNVGRTLHLGDVHADPLPFTTVGLTADGTVTGVDGRPIRSNHLVVNEAGSRIEVAGERLASPAPGLTLYRIEDALRLKSFAEGLHSDGWGRAILSYRVWPRGVTAGSYRVRLELPKGRAARPVELAAGPFETRARLAPERRLELRIPASGRPIPPLAIRIGRADLIDPDTARPRLVGARVTALEFIPNAGSRNR
jgi:hypothetical protein